jgi:hypothetical protein
MRIRSYIILLAIALSVSISAQADIVVNGGFETGFTGWAVTGGCMGVAASSPPGAGCIGADPGTDPGYHSGGYAAYLGATPGTLSQTLATTAGSTYTLSYWLANDSVGGADVPNSFSVSWDGAQIAASVLTDLAWGPYVQYTFSGLVASTASTPLVFSPSNTPADWVLDDVSVNAVPDGGMTIMLLGGALVGLETLRRRFRA